MRHRFPVVWLTLCVIGAPVAFAQDEGATDSDEIGSARILAELRSVAYYSDNFYNQTNGGSSGYGVLISPALGFLKQSAKIELAAGVDGEYGMFDLPGSEDDYLDGAARLRLVAQPTLRNQVRLKGEFKHGHDPFGVDRTEDATARDAELDLWNRTTAALHYRYGAPGARLNAEVGIGTFEKRYTTNRTATEVLNYDSTAADYTLFYNYSSKTSALIDFSRTDFSFDRPFGAVDTRGGELYRVRGGVKWLATGKTSGDVRVGYRRRTFDAGSANIEGFDWEAGVDWAPVPRSTLRLETAHSEQESYRADARVIDIESISLAWKCNLSSRARTDVRLEHANVDFDTSGRSDRILSSGVGLEYLARSNVWVVGNLGMANRTSTIDAREYDRLNAFLGVRLGR